MEHQWLIGARDSGGAEASRAIFVDLVDALVSPDTAATTLETRIAAKHTLAILLQRAEFARAQHDRDGAADRAGRALRECADMVDVAAAPEPPVDSPTPGPVAPLRVRN